MSNHREEGRRANRRTFRPEVGGGRLESRELLSHAPFTLSQYLLTHPQPGVAYRLGMPPQYNGISARIPVGTKNYNKGFSSVQTIRGGQGVQVATPDGSHFRITLQLADNQYDGGLTAQTGGTGTGVLPDTQVQAIGTVRAYPTPGGKVGLIVDGTTQNMQLVIERLPFPQRRGYAHSYAYGQAGRTQVLGISSLNVTTGNIGAILGYQTADLSGPLIIGGSGTVDRLAFNNLLPGASIQVGGTVNTLDVYNNVNLNTGPGIVINGDLNLFNVGQNLTLSNGASVVVSRFVGLTPQPPKGTDTGSNILSLNQALIGSGTSGAILVPGVSAFVRGNVKLSGTSTLTFVSGIANSSIVGATSSAPAIFLINGTIDAPAASSLNIPNVLAGTTLVRAIINTPNGPVTVYNNIVAQNGVFLNGVNVGTIP